MSETSTSHTVLAVRLRKGDSMVRHVYVRPHAGADSLPKDRTLFLNCLPAIGEGSLLELLSMFGGVEQVAVHSSKRSAVVLYEAVAGRDAILNAANKGTVINLDLQEPSQPYGLKAWVEQHKSQKPGNTELQRQLGAWIEDFEAAEERRQQEALRAQEEEGWTVVQRHKGRKRNTSATGISVAGVATAAAQAQAKAKQQSTFGDFYRFQQREKRRNELLDLRLKFEQDKKRVAELKAARKFKPY